MRKKTDNLESYANSAYREYAKAVKIGTIPNGYRKAGECKQPDR